MPQYAPPVVDRRLRFALVGCGRISANHFTALEAHREHAELVAVCDNKPEALEAAATRTGAPGFDSLSRLLAEAQPDVVVVATPSGLHAEHTVMIAQARCHVVCEKPMATRWLDARRMIAECDKSGVRLFVVKQNRTNSTLQLLKRALQNRRFGRIFMVCINVFWNRPQEYYDSASWRGTWEFDGGALMNQASHYIDLLDWLIGPVESVQAYTGTLARDIEVEDSGVIALRWRSGTLGSVNVSMLTYPRNLEGSITILGERGTARIGGVAVNEVQLWDFDRPDEDDEAAKAASYQTDSVYGHGHPKYYRNVIEVLHGRGEPHTDGREGLRSLEILIAAYRSARDGKRISLPLDGWQ